MSRGTASCAEEGRRWQNVQNQASVTVSHLSPTPLGTAGSVWNRCPRVTPSRRRARGTCHQRPNHHWLRLPPRAGGRGGGGNSLAFWSGLWVAEEDTQGLDIASWAHARENRSAEVFVGVSWALSLTPLGGGGVSPENSAPGSPRDRHTARSLCSPGLRTRVFHGKRGRGMRGGGGRRYHPRPSSQQPLPPPAPRTEVGHTEELRVPVKVSGRNNDLVLTLLFRKQVAAELQHQKE